MLVNLYRILLPLLPPPWYADIFQHVKVTVSGCFSGWFPLPDLQLNFVKALFPPNNNVSTQEKLQVLVFNIESERRR